jgi:hypothetical protein
MRPVALLFCAVGVLLTWEDCAYSGLIKPQSPFPSAVSQGGTPMSQAIRFVIILGAFVCLACYRMKPAALDELGEMPSVWATLTDRSTVRISHAKVEGDKLVGDINGIRQELAMARVDAVRVRQLDEGRTAILLAAGATAIAGVVYWVGNSRKPAEVDLSPCLESPSNSCDPSR